MMSAKAVTLLLLICVFENGLCNEISQQKDSLREKVSQAYSSLKAGILELAEMERKERILTYPTSCNHIPKYCKGLPRSGMYKLYSSAKVRRAAGGFTMKADEIYCEFPAGTDDARHTCAFPERADDRALLLPANCLDIQTSYNNMAATGVYRLYNSKWAKKTDSGVRLQEKKALCHMEDKLGGGWTVIQNREKGEVDFFRTWKDYKNGFGDQKGDHWIGNKVLHDLTLKEEYVLRVEMETRKGEKMVAQYEEFKVGSESDKYRLTLSKDEGYGYRGNTEDLLWFANGMSFTTWDADNDRSSHNCAAVYSSGWWFRSCTMSNLNGDLKDGDKSGVWWHKIDNPLHKVIMMIRPRNL